MSKVQVTEDMIFECFAAAKAGGDLESSAKSFVDVEEYENAVMYPEFARWARKAGHPEIARLFLKVAGEEKAHSLWLREMFQEMGVPPRGEDTQRAIDALQTIKENCDRLFASNPEGILEKALKVAYRVENREYKDIYPHFRDQALKANNHRAAAVYQRVIDSERMHAGWFAEALTQLEKQKAAAVA